MNIIIYIVYTIYDTNAWSELWKNNIKEKIKGGDYIILSLQFK